VANVKQYKENILKNLGSTKNEQLKNGLDLIKSGGKILVTKDDASGNYQYDIPNFAYFSGDKGKATLETNFIPDSNLKNDFTIKYYSLHKGSKDPQNDVVDHGETKTG
jgi:hypothetical protein